MFGILLSAFNTVLGFVFKSVIVKFGLFFGLFFVTTQFMSVVGSMLPNSSSLNSAFSGISSDVWYFMNLFAIPQGLPLIISSYCTRFVIRRLPIIG